MVRIVVWVSAVALASCAVAPIPPASPRSPVAPVSPVSTLSPASPASSPTPTAPGESGAAAPATTTAAPASTSVPASVPGPTTATTPTSRPTTPPAGPASSATCSLPAGLLGQDIERIPGARKLIALTFDAGAAPDGADRILATLSAQRVPATFFLTGRFTLANPELARRMAASYPLGNHTQTHPDLTSLGDAAVRRELDQGRTAILDVTGQDPRPYFRFPFGAVDRRTIGLVNAQCYVPFRWTVDSLGWKGTSGGMSADKVYQRVIDGATAGGIVLMHVGSNPDDSTTLDADALPRIIDELRARGYELVTLEAVLPAAP